MSKWLAWLVLLLGPGLVFALPDVQAVAASLGTDAAG